MVCSRFFSTSFALFIFQIAPSSVFHNGTSIVYTVRSSRHPMLTWLKLLRLPKCSLSWLLYLQYHGITQMKVEDDTSPSRKGRKANIRVVSRGAQQQAPAVKSEPRKKLSTSRRTGPAQENVRTNTAVLFPSLCLKPAWQGHELFQGQFAVAKKFSAPSLAFYAHG